MFWTYRALLRYSAFHPVDLVPVIEALDTVRPAAEAKDIQPSPDPRRG